MSLGTRILASTLCAIGKGCQFYDTDCADYDNVSSAFVNDAFFEIQRNSEVAVCFVRHGIFVWTLDQFSDDETQSFIESVGWV